MTLEEEVVLLRAEDARLQAEQTRLTTALAAALERVAALKAQLASLQGSKPTPAFVKADVPAKEPTPRKRRAPEQNKGAAGSRPPRSCGMRSTTARTAATGCGATVSPGRAMCWTCPHPRPSS